MGAVYRATDTRSGREVALKLLLGLADPEDRARFVREVEVSSSLAHPHLLRVLDFGQDRGQLYLASELAEGGSLSDRLRSGPLPADEAARLVAQVARGLEVAHRAGVLHRDLKPDNVLLDAAGRPLLADFGLARRVQGETLTATGSILGTPGYLSPEQARGERAEVRSDVYGLGALLYAALSGRPPFRAASLLATLAAVDQDPPAPLAVPPALWAVVERCLAKDPARRYPSAEAVAEALEAAGARPRTARLGLGAGLGAGACVLIGALWLRSAAPQAPLPPSTPLASSSPSPSAPPWLSWTEGEAQDEPPRRGKSFPRRYHRLPQRCRALPPEQAEELIERALRQRPRDPALYMQRAILEHPDDPERAHETLREASRLLSEQAWVHAGCAQAYYSFQDYERSLAAATRAVELAPEVGEYVAIQAALFAMTKRPELALRAWERARELMPLEPFVIRERCAYFLHHAEDLARGAKDAELLVTLDPLSFDAWRLLAYARLRQDRLEEALAIAAHAQVLYPTPYGGYVRGLCYSKLRDWEAAAREFRAALQATAPPEASRTFPYLINRELANVLFAARRFEEALAASDAALADEPNKSVILLKRSKILLALRRDAEAERDARRALELGAGWDAQLQLARALRGQRRREEALASFDRTLEQTTSTAIELERARLLIAMGRREDAAAALRSLKGRGPKGHQQQASALLERLREGPDAPR